MDSNAAYEDIQVNAFASLVQDGVYSEQFDHPPHSQQFFNEVMFKILGTFEKRQSSGLRVLDCGCGNGAWLDYLTTMQEADIVRSVYGFDLTPDMVNVARNRLSSSVPAMNFHAGNILQPDSYRFSNTDAKYDLLFTYDVIQQLPPELQFTGIETMLEHMSDDGVAIIFDNDAKSRFGRAMARKKFLTRYFRLKLVPRYYCNASYPPLAKMAEKLVEDRGKSVEIHISGNGVKRALIITNTPH